MTLDIVIFGLSMTSSWGNGHASTYRALVKALHQRGHRITFLERDVPWYRAHRDLHDPPYCRTELYTRLVDVPRRYANLVAKADLVIVGSYVPDGKVLADWVTMHARGVTAFYDIDTPVTLAALEAGRAEYISAALVPRFDLYLSFTGGPVLELIESRYGSPRARTLYCSVDPQLHYPVEAPQRWSLGYLGTYSQDRQEALQELLLEPARGLADQHFVVAGPSYPPDTTLATQRRAHRSRGAGAALRILWQAALHAEHHPFQHDPVRLLAQRPAVRGGSLRRPDHQRSLARHRFPFSSRIRKFSSSTRPSRWSRCCVSFPRSGGYSSRRPAGSACSSTTPRTGGRASSSSITKKQLPAAWRASPAVAVCAAGRAVWPRRPLSASRHSASDCSSSEPEHGSDVCTSVPAFVLSR